MARWKEATSRRHSAECSGRVSASVVPRVFGSSGIVWLQSQISVVVIGFLAGWLRIGNRRAGKLPGIVGLCHVRLPHGFRGFRGSGFRLFVEKLEIHGARYLAQHTVGHRRELRIVIDIGVETVHDIEVWIGE